MFTRARTTDLDGSLYDAMVDIFQHPPLPFVTRIAH